MGVLRKLEGIRRELRTLKNRYKDKLTKGQKTILENQISKLDRMIGKKNLNIEWIVVNPKLSVQLRRYIQKHQTEGFISVDDNKLVMLEVEEMFDIIDNYNECALDKNDLKIISEIEENNYRYVLLN